MEVVILSFFEGNWAIFRLPHPKFESFRTLSVPFYLADTNHENLLCRIASLFCDGFTSPNGDYPCGWRDHIESGAGE